MKNRCLLSGDAIILYIYLYAPGFLYSYCRPLSKFNERRQKLKKPLILVK